MNRNAKVADDAGAVFANATVNLYVDDGDGAIDAGDLFIGTTPTNGSGQYSFANLGNATYWVTVDSKTLAAPAYNGGFTINNVWAEQTYGVAGAAQGAGFLGAAGALYAG